MDYIWKYDSPLGGITLASDGSALVGLWFDGQRFFASSLLPAPPSAPSSGAASVLSSGAAFAPSAAFAFSHETKDSSPSDFEGLLAAGFTARPLPVFDQACRWLDIYFSGREPGFTPPLVLRGTPFRMAVWSGLLRIPFGSTVTYGAIAASLSSASLSSASTASPSIASLSFASPALASPPVASPALASPPLASPPLASPAVASPAPSVSRPSARAVGGAVGRNPISLIVPCHRVVGAAGRRAGASVGPTMVGPLTGYAGGLDRKLRLLELEGVIL